MSRILALLLLIPMASAMQQDHLAVLFDSGGVMHKKATQDSFPDGAIASPKGKLNLDACKSGGQWPKLEKFDLVISWWTKKPQSNDASSFLELGQASKLVRSDSAQKTSVQNQAEIMYELRSFEKYGMLDHVDQVFVLIDQDVLSKYGAPRFFDYGHTKIKVVSSEVLGLGKGGQTEKVTHLHKIPGLGDYFLWVPDDNFMMHKFDVNELWSEDRHAPKLHEFGTWSPGWCDNQHPTGSMHGPVLLQKCAFTAVMDRYFGSSASLTSAVLQASSKSHSIDTFCLFTRAMAQDWKNEGFDTNFQEECHTNGGCNPNSRALFMNIQGNMVSDEYGLSRPMTSRGQEMMPAGAVKYFESKYPSPSRFEKAGWSVN